MFCARALRVSSGVCSGRREVGVGRWRVSEWCGMAMGECSRPGGGGRSKRSRGYEGVGPGGSAVEGRTFRDSECTLPSGGGWIGRPAIRDGVARIDRPCVSRTGDGGGGALGAWRAACGVRRRTCGAGRAACRVRRCGACGVRRAAQDVQRGTSDAGRAPQDVRRGHGTCGAGRAPVGRAASGVGAHGPRRGVRREARRSSEVRPRRGAWARSLERWVD